MRQTSGSGGEVLPPVTSQLASVCMAILRPHFQSCPSSTLPSLWVPRRLDTLCITAHYPRGSRTRSTDAMATHSHANSPTHLLYEMPGHAPSGFPAAQMRASVSMRRRHLHWSLACYERKPKSSCSTVPQVTTSSEAHMKCIGFVVAASQIGSSIT